MKKYLFYLLTFVLGISLGWFLSKYLNRLVSYIFKNNQTPSSITFVAKPFEKYSIKKLSETSFEPQKIETLRTLEENDSYTSFLFSMSFNPAVKGGQLKKTTGVINIPNGQKSYPLIVMFRGYVDKTIYASGVGTYKAASYFAKNGFITISPDFLGYAESDIEAGNIFESRFQTYTLALNLLSSLDSIEKWDRQNLFIWGHSNGGQIALTVLEATQKEIPTVLWAPVSKPFPYSVLYYTDESDDLGKLIRSELSSFEEKYDVNEFSIHNYYSNIKASIQLHQGGYDDAVPIEWSDTLYQTFKNLEIDITYYTYPTADHNLKPNWNTVVQRDLEFFTSKIKN